MLQLIDVDNIVSRSRHVRLVIKSAGQVCLSSMDLLNKLGCSVLHSFGGVCMSLYGFVWVCVGYTAKKKSRMEYQFQQNGICGTEKMDQAILP